MNWDTDVWWEPHKTGNIELLNSDEITLPEDKVSLSSVTEV